VAHRLLDRRLKITEIDRLGEEVEGARFMAVRMLAMSP
jgi:hypothetical protein